MAIPDYEACMLPLLTRLADGEIHTMKELSRQVADHFGLTDEERQRVLPSGQQSYINNRVGWAKSYMKKAGLIENPSRGRVRITEEGRAVLLESPPSINCEYLKKYPSFVEFWKEKRKSVSDEGDQSPSNGQPQDEQTPDEAIEADYKDNRAALADEF